ncbi:MAG TPA: fatty acid--CoA ligase [bacterium]|nr:fatty acid--CoA ligase [bacterium]
MNVPLTPLEFRRRAERLFGRKVGVVDGGRRFTYTEFGERSRRLAAAIQALGIRPGEVVSFLTYNTHHLLEAYYGVLQAGAVLNPINIRLHPNDIRYVLNHAESRALFFHRDFAPTVQAMHEGLETVREFVALEPDGAPPVGAADYETLLKQATPLAADPDVDEDRIAELFYTSGTTGQPKGVALTHRALYLHALYAIIGMGDTDRSVLLHIVPMFHVNGWGAPHTITAVGGTHVMLRKIDPVDIFRLIQAERVTDIRGVPAIFNALVNHPDAGRYDLSSLRLAMCGGAPPPPALVKAAQDRFGCEFMVGYGLTETSPVLTLAKPKAHLLGEPPERQLERRARTGHPIAGVEIRVLDDNGRDVPADGVAVGEIVTRSNVVMEGYFKDPASTAAAIRDGWFHTGDMANLDSEGSVNIVDRKKDIIISGGENISSVQIENALYAHPAVFECAVIPVPDEKWGEVPKALVALKPGAIVSETELLDFCRERLAGFMVPKSVEFRDALPKGGTGKILKAELREKYWADQPRRVH